MKYETIITQVIDWMTKIKDSFLSSNPRQWCSLGLSNSLNQENINKYFDRTELNDEYKKRYNENSIDNKKSFSYIQAEIDAIYSTHKCFTLRHQSRLHFYRTDCSNKDYRLPSAINISYGKFKAESDTSEKL